MTAIVLLVALGTVFVVGLLLGQQWNRHALQVRERELAVERKERAALAWALERFRSR